MLVFRLRKPGLVEFLVVQIAPVCDRIGRFRIFGRAGVNRVPVRARVARRPLAPGAYRIVARTVPRGRHVTSTNLVVVSRPNGSEISTLRHADACAAAPTAQGAATSAAAKSGPSATALKKQSATKSRSRDHGVLGTRFTKRAFETAKNAPALLYALLLVAICLLAIAAVPPRVAPSNRSAAVLARSRGPLALAGASALLGTMVAWVLT
jgi:hypothetical protein